MNGTQYYTIFDLPIDVINSIPINTQYSSSKARPLCALRNNPLLSPSQTNSSVTPLPYQPFLGGNSSISGSNSASSSSASTAQSPSSTANAGDGSSSGTNSGACNLPRVWCERAIWKPPRAALRAPGTLLSTMTLDLQVLVIYLLICPTHRLLRFRHRR